VIITLDSLIRLRWHHYIGKKNLIYWS